MSKGDREKKNDKKNSKEKLEIHLGYSLLEIICMLLEIVYSNYLILFLVLFFL